MTTQEEETEEQGGGGSGFDAETIRSYVTFVKRAVQRHRLMLGSVLVVGLALSVVVMKYFPRTYNCTTVLLGLNNQVLEGRDQAVPLVGATSLILRHENLESIIRDVGLIKKFRERRQPLLKLKDQVFAAVFGELNDDIMKQVLVGTMEAKIGVEVEGSELTISVDWGDPQTAAELADAARESFVSSRHSAEMSAFEEKIAILDGHATKLRDEVENLAEQVRTQAKERLAEDKAATAAATPSAAPVATAAPRVVRRAAGPDPEAPVLREKLDGMKRKLSELESERDRKRREEQQKLADLKLKLGPSHPEVLTQNQRLAMAMQEPSELALLRADVKSTETQLKQRESLAKLGTTSIIGGSAAAGTASAAAAEPLPSDIGRLLDADGVDPALAAQLRGAVVQFGSLRDEIRSARINLDTAQAAFNHRYKVIVPADAPSKPIKPKPALILIGGIFLSLIVGLLLPILAELRKGKLVSRWQVQTVALPILAELRLPPHTNDPNQGP
jgi:uncharacterized protein involved in exopolysaccharide biosynthesis